jgi:CubicO group peptidase (beta-lactamase class C family)
MDRHLALALVVLFAAGPGRAEDADAAKRPAEAATPAAKRDREKVVPLSLAELEVEIREVLKATRTPGAGIALVSRDRVLWTAGLGTADLASGRPATADTLFRIGSITKSMVALAVLMLVEEGKLHLDDPVRPLAPDVFFENRWEASDPVRVEQLLEHTAGFDDFSFREYANSDPRPLTLKEGLDYAPRSRTVRWRPGTRMAYANSGPAVAAYVVERLSGEPFETFVQRRIFDPLRMSTATFLETDAVKQNGATLYRADGVTPNPYWHILMRPAGSVNASAAEMARYLQLFLGRGTFEGKALVSPASIDRMEVPATTEAARAGLRAGYGLGNFAISKGGLVLHGHDGGVNDGRARLLYQPELGVGWVVLINSGSGEALDEIGTLLRNYVTRDLPRPTPPPVVKVSEATRRAFEGWFVADNPRQEQFAFVQRLLGLMHLRFGDEGFVARPLLGKKKTFLAVSERLYREKDDPVPTLVLLDTPEGRKIGAGWNSYRQLPWQQAWLQTGLLGLVLATMLSALLFAGVWVPRRLFGKLRRAPAIAVRALPLLSVVCLAGSLALFFHAEHDLLVRLGRPSGWSVGICLGTWAFALSTVLSLILAFGPRSWLVKRAVRWHARAVAVACALAAGYLAAFGVIGLRTWI